MALACTSLIHNYISRSGCVPHTDGVDYFVDSEALEFPANAAAGDTSCVNFTVIDDDVFENTEGVLYQITDVSGTGIIFDSANSEIATSVSIINNDGKESIVLLSCSILVQVGSSKECLSPP